MFHQVITGVRKLNKNKKDMKPLNEFLNEGKYQKVWQTEKYINADGIELVGDKHASPADQVYQINKNKKQVGSFSFDRETDGYWLSAPSLGFEQESFDTIDDIIKFVKKNL